MTAALLRVSIRGPKSGPINPAATLMDCNRRELGGLVGPRESAMRFAWWRGGREMAQADQPVVTPAPAPAAPDASASQPGDIDLRALGAALSRKRRWIVLPTLLALAVSVGIVNVIT